jgi:WD40 repeat protein
MSDTRDLLRSALEDFEPAPDAFERVLVRRDRKRRNARVAAGIVGVAIFVLAVLGLARLLESERTVGLPEPTQPTNGRWVVFSARHLDPDPGAPQASRGERFNLYVADTDGTARLLVGSEGDKGTRACPVFTPDGSLLAWGEKSRPAIAGGEIVLSGFSASGELSGEAIRIPVPTMPPYFGAPCPTWAPVGRRLAVFAPRQGLLLAAADGTTTTIPIDGFGQMDEVRGLEWSPDGSRLAVLSWPDASGSTVWVVSLEGDVQPVIEFDADEVPVTVAWTMDSRLVVVAGQTQPGASPSPFVRVVDVATRGVSDVPLPEAWEGSSFVSMLSTESERFLVQRAGLEGWSAPEWLDLQGRVTPIGDLPYQPTSFISLSPDRTQMLYVTYDPAQPEQGQAIFSVPLDGSEPSRYSPWTPAGFGDNYSTFTWQPG